jgi:hypothetical protein
MVLPRTELPSSKAEEKEAEDLVDVSTLPPS